MIGTSKSVWGFDPRSVPGCQLWLDGSDQSSMTLSGSSVTQWNDKSGNGGNATRLTGDSYATLTTISGNRILSFPGANAVYRSPMVLTGAAYTIFTISSLLSTSGNGSGYQRMINTELRIFVGANNGNLAIFSGSGVGWNDINPNTPSYTLLGAGLQLVTMVVSGSTLIPYINGTAMDTKTGSTTPATTVLDIGGQQTNAQHWNGYIGDIIVFNTALTTSQRQQIEGYLAHKWGLTGYYDSSIPLTIPGCMLWLDGNDTSSQSMILTGNTVNTWKDKSGNGYNYTQTSYSTTLPPLSNIKTGTGVYFGSQQGLYNTSFPFPTSYTIFSVANQTTNLGGYQYLLHSPYNADYIIFFGSLNGNFATFTGSGGWNDTNANSPSSSIATTSNTASILCCTNNGTTLTPYFNTVAMSTKTGTNSAATGMTLGDTDTANARQPWLGTVGEILVYNSVLTTSQRQTIEGYLAKKWGLTSLYSALPSTHPFSSIRPHLRTFQPSDIDGCQLWLDAADPNAMTLSGTSVVSVLDKSGNGFNLTGGSGWTYNVTKFNGSYPSFYSSTSGSMLGQNNSFSISSSNITVFFVGVSEGISTYPYITDGGSSGNNRFFNYIDPEPTSPYYNSIVHGDSVLYFTLYPALSTSMFFKPFIFSQSTGTSPQTGSYNGTSFNTTTGNTGTITWSGITVAGRFNNTTGWHGHVCEMIVYNTALSTPQRQQIEGYLAWKWGISATLPSPHPFKSFPPATLPFSPRNISGLALWLDAADQSSMTFSSGSNLSVWKDKSSYGNNFSLTSGTTSNINDGGYSVVNFPSGAIMSSANQITFTTSSAFFIVSKLTALSASTISMVVGFTNINEGDLTFVRYNPSAILNGTAATTTSERDIGNNNYYVNGTFNPSTFGSNYYLNTYSIIGTVLPSTGGTSYLTLSSAFMSRYFIGNISEFLYYPTGLTSSQRQQIEGYLARKWGLTTSLPATHPYKKLPA